MNKRKEKLRRRQSPRETGTMTGRLRMARNGAGFLVDPETDKAVWIEERDLGTALPDDTVTIKLKGAGDEGVLLRIDERAPRSIVGTVTAVGRFTRVQPLNPAYRQEFTVSDAKGARVGDRVVMSLVRWENRHLAPEGAITDVIGPKDDPSLDTLAVMKQYDLPESFPRGVLDAAEHVSARLAEPGKRLDLRRKFIFTCDPASARDYDDALSIETDRQGNRVLGVHIADVSHFVTPGSALDREAYRRSTSVYLVDKVVPMLPEQLSNGVCSLVPGQDRLAFSAFLTFDAKGNCVAHRFAKSVIRSKARFTYEQVMAVISTKQGLKPKERKTILAIHELAQQLRRNRFAAGALDMDVPEAQILLDEKGMMTGIEVRPYDESHQLVEECMVAANEAVAKELWTRGVKILARLHEPPDPEKLEDLRANLAKIGISCGDLAQQKNLARFLEKIKGSREEVLRALHLAHPPLPRPRAAPPARLVDLRRRRTPRLRLAQARRAERERTRAGGGRRGARARRDQEVPLSRRGPPRARQRVRRGRRQVHALRSLRGPARARRGRHGAHLEARRRLRALRRVPRDPRRRRQDVGRGRPSQGARGEGGLRPPPG